MKIEVPQISWHGIESDKGRNAPLLSCSIVESGLHDDDFNTFTHVLATAGNDSIVNLWKLSFLSDSPTNTKREEEGVHIISDNVLTSCTTASSNNRSSNNNNNNNGSTATINNKSFVKIEHLTSLKRHERSVNALKFSPDGLTLATAGDGGSIILWSIPRDKRGGSNGKHFWSLVEKESDLECRILPSGGGPDVGGSCNEDLLDVQWSPCSTKFVVCSLDYCLLVFEDTQYYNHTAVLQKKNNATATTTAIGNNNPSGSTTNAASAAAAATVNPSPVATTKTSVSESVTSGWKCASCVRDHTHYVQGVCYDPLGVYICSQSSDRSVRVYSPKEHTKRGKFELQQEATLKHWPRTNTAATTNSTGDSSDKQDKKAATSTPTRSIPFFAEEANVESFFRRLSWTTDGAFLIVPAGLLPPPSKTPPSSGDEKKNDTDHEVEVIASSTGSASANQSPSSFGTYLFARHCFDRPVAALPALSKPSVVVRPCPVLFHLPETTVGSVSDDETSSKFLLIKRDTPSSSYRSIFAVLTLDTVAIYDTRQPTPLALLKGFHYAALTDCAWTADGRSLVVTSSDGYISFVRWNTMEMGRVYTPVASTTMSTTSKTTQSDDKSSTKGVERTATAAIPETITSTATTKDGKCFISDDDQKDKMFHHIVKATTSIQNNERLVHVEKLISLVLVAKTTTTTGAAPAAAAAAAPVNNDAVVNERNRKDDNASPPNLNKQGGRSSNNLPPAVTPQEETEERQQQQQQAQDGKTTTKRSDGTAATEANTITTKKKKRRVTPTLVSFLKMDDGASKATKTTNRATAKSSLSTKPKGNVDGSASGTVSDPIMLDLEEEKETKKNDADANGSKCDDPQPVKVTESSSTITEKAESSSAAAADAIAKPMKEGPSDLKRDGDRNEDVLPATTAATTTKQNNKKKKRRIQPTLLSSM